MFAQVAPRYDLLNHLLSASLDRLWRRRAAEALAGAGDGLPVLDLCCGTGDQALALARRSHRVVASDFCLPMLTLARGKYAAERAAAHGLAADTLRLPFADGIFGGATVSFGLRNVEDLDTALAEIRRVLAPGARLVVLEFAMPDLPPLRSLYRVYFRRVLPWIGRRLSDSSSAYSYLPSSVVTFPQRADFVERMEGAGFATTGWEDLSGGIVCLYTARRPLD